MSKSKISMSSLLSEPVAKKLHAGAYPATIQSILVVDNEKGGNIKITYALPDREISQVYFPNNLRYLISCLSEQLNLEADGELTRNDVLAASKGVEIKVWIKYTSTYGFELNLHDANAEAESDAVEIKHETRTSL